MDQDSSQGKQPRRQGRPEKTIVSQRLAVLRVRAGMTQFELAAKAGIPLATVSAIEQGTRGKPGFETLVGLAKAIGCTVGQLCGTEEIETKDQ